MKRRVVGILLALVLAAVGTVLLVSYVKNAKDDAVKKEEQVSVLVVSDSVAQGTSVADLAAHVSATDVPRRLVAADAVTSLDNLDQTLVTSVALVPGDQLVASRLVAPHALVSVSVPDGLQEVTIALEPQRAVGGALQPGSLVGIVLSYPPFSTGVAGDTTATSVEAGTQTPNSTHLTLQKVLVTAVQLSTGDAQRVAGADSSDTTLPANVNQAPTDQLLVTIAVSASEAEQIVFAAEFGHIWLTLQTATTNEDGTRILTLNQAYVSVARP